MTALLLGRRLGEPEPVAAAAPEEVAAATVTPPAAKATASRLSSEFKWPPPPLLPPSAQADQVDDDVELDEVAEWTLAGAASDVNEDEEDELPHLDDVDVVDVMAASLVGANSDERKETERRGDEDEQVAIPFRTPPDRIALLLVAGPSLIWHKQTNKQTKTLAKESRSGGN